jgi:hypothetical protein
MSRRSAHVTTDGRYVIVGLPEGWGPGDPLPASSPNDQWFDSYLEFMSAWRAPYDREPIDRQPWSAPSNEPEPNN